MAEKDRTKWNQKYQEKPVLLEARPPSLVLENHYRQAPGKHAIDLACGSGRNSIFLAKHGFCVDAVDISSVALSSLHEHASDLDITPIEADLDTFTPKEAYYDLAVMTNYLDRKLIARTAASLKPQALFVIETYMQHPENEKQDSNPDFLLGEGELKTLLEGSFEILHYVEFWNEPHELYRMRKQGIVGRKNKL